MIHLRRSCTCLRLPNCRHFRLRLWFLLIAFVIIFLAVQVLLSFLPRWVKSSSGVVMPPFSWFWLLPSFNAVRPQTNGLKGHATEAQAASLEAEHRPVMWSSECRPPHMIWDTNLRHTDRIVEQLNYFPKHRRLFYSHILVYNKAGGETVPPGNLLFKQNGCLVDSCNITLDISTAEHVDALVTSVAVIDQLLLKRRPEDIYVFYHLESPKAFYTSTAMPGFNWTATYRHDSTIVTPYEKWVPFENNTDAGYFRGIDLSSEASLATGKNYAAGKYKAAAALISNCVGGRLRVISELAKYIKVDVYGSCGTDCGGDCMKMIHREYKFYLAFENANCVDYITEKLFQNALSNDILPVVFGAPSSDYIRSAPPYSYIHVDNYPSTRHLAMYLRDLDNNDDLYNVYFKWKGTGSFINTKFWCRLCAMVNDLDKPHVAIPDVRAWFLDNACGNM